MDNRAGSDQENLHRGDPVCYADQVQASTYQIFAEMALLF